MHIRPLISTFSDQMQPTNRNRIEKTRAALTSCGGATVAAVVAAAAVAVAVMVSGRCQRSNP